MTDMRGMKIDNRLPVFDTVYNQLERIHQAFEGMPDTVKNLTESLNGVTHSFNGVVDGIATKEHGQTLNDILGAGFDSSLRLGSQFQQRITNGNSNAEIVSSYDEIKQWKQSIDVVNSGFTTVGATIQKKITEELRKSDGEFQKFVTGVLSGIEQIAEKLASRAIFAGILSLVTGGLFGELFGNLSGLNPSKHATGGILTEPVLGFGMTTGQSYMMSEAGPERIEPLTSFGKQGEPLVIHITGSFRSSGRDLISTFKEARIIDRKLGGKL